MLLFKDNQKRLVEDPMEFLVLMLDFKGKRIMALTFFMVFVLLSKILNCAAIFVLTAEKAQFQQYISMLLLEQPAFLASIAVVKFSKEFEKVRSTFTSCWAISAAGEETEKNILRVCKYFKIFSVVLLLSSVATHLTIALPLIGDEEYFNISLMILKTNVPSWSRSYLHTLYCMGAIVYGYMMAYPILFLLRLLFYLNFQIDLLNEHLLNISQDYDFVIRGFDIVSDEDYQEVIYQRLKICIAHHVNIRRLTKKYVNICKVSMLMIPFGSVAPVGACYFILYEVSPRSNFRMILVLVTFCFLVVSICAIGQKYNDKNEKLFLLAYESPWVYWNNKNRCALLLLQTAASVPLRISSYTTVNINFCLLLTFQKWIYALVTLLY